MRRRVRGFLWIIKAMLLAIALAALILWPMSYGHRAYFRAWRFTAADQRVDEVRFAIGWRDGRIGLRAIRMVHSGPSLEYGKLMASGNGSGWKMRSDPRFSDFVLGPMSHSLGPIRWEQDIYQSDHFAAFRAASFPCWLLALLAAIWPLTSVTLLIRRRAAFAASAKGVAAANAATTSAPRHTVAGNS